jgi:Ni/Fe-hydrogenase subunit HybB-like protein
VSRARTVRLARAAAGQFDLRGWLCAILALAGTLWLVWPWTTRLQVAVLILGAVWAAVGMHWARWNLVHPIEVRAECECGRELGEGSL